MSEVVPIGADHAGFELKEKLKDVLRRLGFEPEDVGTASNESVDYPDFAKQVAAKVSDGRAKRGVLLCGTGLGMSYAANRYANVRAAVAWSAPNSFTARSHASDSILSTTSHPP